MKNIFLILIFFSGFFLPNNPCQAQEIIQKPKAFLITSIPIKQYTGGVIVIKARLGNIPDSLNFILDTGSGGISLDSSTCVEFKIETWASDTTINGIGGMRKVDYVFNQTLLLPGLSVDHLNFHVNNYEVLSSVYGEKIDGIIGYSFLSRYIVAINYDSSFMQVFSPGKFNYPRGGTILHPAFTSLPIQWLNIKDRKKMGHNFYFDTGAGICLLLSSQFASDSNILLSKRKPVLTQAQGMTGKLQMNLTIIRELKIGPYVFKKVPTYIYDDAFNVTSYPFTGGLIGSDILRRFNIVLNYPNKEIHLLPNGHFNDFFDYAYTGLGIYFEDGKIIVGDIIEDSPAAISKFLVGDEILSVGTNFSHNINIYKNLLQVPNQNIKVLVQRKGEYFFINLRTLRIK